MFSITLSKEEVLKKLNNLSIQERFEKYILNPFLKNLSERSSTVCIKKIENMNFFNGQMVDPKQINRPSNLVLLNINDVCRFDDNHENTFILFNVQHNQDALTINIENTIKNSYQLPIECYICEGTFSDYSTRTKFFNFYLSMFHPEILHELEELGYKVTIKNSTIILK